MTESTPQPRGVLPVVRFSLECAGIEWHVRRIDVQEALGRPYRARVDLVTTEIDVIADELVGADIELCIERGESTRAFKGCVLEVEHHGIASGRTFLTLFFGPGMVLLHRSRRSRIFQDRSVPEILEAVIGPVLAARGRELDASALGLRTFEPREFCVQYRETDLGFVHRLLEEEGLSYAFDQERQKHEVVVLIDAASAVADYEGADGSIIVPIVHDRNDEAGTESIEGLSWRRVPQSPTVVQRDWDWTTDPATVHEDEASAAQEENILPLEPLPGAVHVEHGDHRLLDLDLVTRARRKREALAAREQIARGTSSATGFAPGVVFELDEDAHHGRHRLASVLHHGDAPEVDLHAGGGERAPAYRNEFHCVPEGRPYRQPRETPRPVIVGPQTAVVTGPPGEEIHTDEHGRIKVRMHWDRGNTPPEDASCWIRVAQAWGGPGWGAMFLPRVGMEVVVLFVDGDPDRPLCMGSVYNGQNRPPYPLPDERTKSTIKTRSSPGGEGFNELRFEDAAGNEQVFVHAQRDLDEVARRNHSRSVGNDETISVGGNRTVAVEGNHSITVSGTDGDGAPLPAPHYSVDVKDDARLHASKTIRVEAETSITLQCQQTMIELTPTSITLRAGNGASVVLDIAALLQSKPGGVVSLDAEGGVTCESAAAAQLRLDSVARVQSKAGSNLMLDGGAELAAGGDPATPGASMTLTEDVDLRGNAVMVASEAASLEMTSNAALSAMDLELSGTNASCTAAQGLTLGAATVEVRGTALATMTAPLVKVN
ncbi:MAG: type VI secretion system tip protein VgrG [Myxococcales bacterium]|nr:type VI secretion system tip protein VgrG [Myxococcales bacterium]